MDAFYYTYIIRQRLSNNQDCILSHRNLSKNLVVLIIGQVMCENYKRLLNQQLTKNLYELIIKHGKLTSFLVSLIF
jgi:Asp-tRNA(Asn)/Glu-tRNA(Gln) amidotransferase B subunit